VQYNAARRFIDWLVSPRGQELVGGYMIDGERLFYPPAKKQQ
jgi:tungstate transport system substrate-binding protein